MHDSFTFSCLTRVTLISLCILSSFVFRQNRTSETKSLACARGTLFLKRHSASPHNVSVIVGCCPKGTDQTSFPLLLGFFFLSFWETELQLGAQMSYSNTPVASILLHPSLGFRYQHMSQIPHIDHSLMSFLHKSIFLSVNLRQFFLHFLALL